MFFLEKAEMAKMLDICSISAWMFLKPQDSQEQHSQQREVPILRWDLFDVCCEKIVNFVVYFFALIWKAMVCLGPRRGPTFLATHW